MSEEGLEETKNKRIFIGQPIEMDYAQFEKGLWELDEAVWRETGDIRRQVQKLVPGYHYTEPEPKELDNVDGDPSVTDDGFCALQEAAAGLEWKSRHKKLAEQSR